MNAERLAKIRERAREIAAEAPPFSPELRLRLVVLLRPDMPLGIAPAADLGTPRRRKTA